MTYEKEFKTSYGFKVLKWKLNFPSQKIPELKHCMNWTTALISLVETENCYYKVMSNLTIKTKNVVRGKAKKKKDYFGFMF